MTRWRSWPIALVAAIAVLGTSVVTAHAADAFQPLAQGIEYRHDVRAAGPLSIHVLRIERQQKLALEAGLGQGTVFGLEPLDGLVCRIAAATKSPLWPQSTAISSSSSQGCTRVTRKGYKLPKANWSAGPRGTHSGLHPTAT